MEVDHLISLYHAWKNGVCGEELKRLANDPRNLRFTHWQTNRSKGSLSPEEFADMLPDKTAKHVRKDATSLMGEYGIPPLPVLPEKRLAALSEELEYSKTQLDDTNEDLSRSRAQLGRLRGQIVKYRGEKTKLSTAVEYFTSRMSRRVKNSAIRNAGSMAGESLPMVGSVVVVGVTALEMKDACDTLKDMHELNAAFNPNAKKPDDVTKVCDLYQQLPSAADVRAAVLSSPSEVWRNTKELVPTLPEMESMEVDWVGYLNAVGSGVTWIADSSTATMTGFYDALRVAWKDMLWSMYWGSD